MRRIVLLSLLSLALAACASKPVPVEFRAVADDALNLDEQGRPLSLVFRVYQLRDAEAFQRLTYESLNEGKPDADLFGTSLVSRSEHVMLPGQPATLPTSIAPETKFLGVVGFFRRPDSQQWRFLFDRESVLKKGLTVRAHSCHMQFEAPRPLALAGQDLSRAADCPPLVLAVQQPPAAPVAEEKPQNKKKTGKQASARKAGAGAADSAQARRNVQTPAQQASSQAAQQPAPQSTQSATQSTTQQLTQQASDRVERAATDAARKAIPSAASSKSAAAAPSAAPVVQAATAAVRAVR